MLRYDMVSFGANYLTKSSFKLFCAKCYQNPDNPGMDDLERDLKYITQIKRMISDYVDKGEIKDRQILNNIIVLGNLFGPENAVKILFFKIDEPCWSALKTFLKYLNFMPASVFGLKKPVINQDIPTDVDLYRRLLLL